MRATIELSIKPFTVPNFVIGEVAGEGDGRSIALWELSPETLDAMCNEFREAVFKKAGKRDPVRVNRGAACPSGWRVVPAPLMANTMPLPWGVTSVYAYLQTPEGDKGACVELQLPPLPDSRTNQETTP